MPTSQSALNSRDGMAPSVLSTHTDGETAIESIHRIAQKIDENLGELGQPLKPYLPTIGRVLVVATFLEDCWRILTQWRSQVRYIWTVRGVPWILTVIFLILNVIMMLGGSFAVVAKKHLLYGVGSLLGVVVSQAIVYGLIFNGQFFLRNLSLVGGLLLVVSDVFAQDRRRLGLPGLPQLDTKNRSRYLQLAGRILLILLFISHLARSKWTVSATFFNIFILAVCTLVTIGYKARLSASILVVLLFAKNLLSNSYWRLSSNHPDRDILRYEHFQTLSIIGGLILLVNMGAGRLSIDEKKKIY